MNAAFEAELRYMFNMISQLHLMMYESKEYTAKPRAHQIEYDITSQIHLMIMMYDSRRHILINDERCKLEIELRYNLDIVSQTHLMMYNSRRHSLINDGWCKLIELRYNFDIWSQTHLMMYKSRRHSLINDEWCELEIELRHKHVWCLKCNLWYCIVEQSSRLSPDLWRGKRTIVWS